MGLNVSIQCIMVVNNKLIEDGPTVPKKIIGKKWGSKFEFIFEFLERVCVERNEGYGSSNVNISESHKILLWNRSNPSIQSINQSLISQQETGWDHLLYCLKDGENSWAPCMEP